MNRVRALGSWLMTGVLSMVVVATVVSHYQSPSFSSLDTTTSSRPSASLTTQIDHSSRVGVPTSSDVSPIHEASRVVQAAPSTTTTVESDTPKVTTTTSSPTAPWTSSTTTTSTPYGGGGSDDGSGGDGGGGGGGGDGGGGDN